MKLKVVYHSTTGNTKKIADVIAQSLKVKAEPIAENQEPSREPVDMLFIGDGMYFGNISKKTKQFIKSLSSDTVKKAAVFATYGGNGKGVKIIKSLLSEQGIQVMESSFACKGQAWAILNRNLPNQSDIDSAKTFAQNIIKDVK